MFVLFYSLVLVLSFYLLAIICEDYFVPALDRIAHKLKLPDDVVGATFMAVGSSAPEFFTAFFAVILPGNKGNIGSGTIVGSAIFNILVIVGASVMYRRSKLTWQPVLRDLIFYALSIILLLLSFWDGKIVVIEAILFVILYVVYIIIVFYWQKWLKYTDDNPIEILEEEISQDKNRFNHITVNILNLIIPNPVKYPKQYWFTFIMAITAIAGLSYVLVESAVHIGDLLNINSTIIALTVLAGGTSIPDLLSSIIVAKRGRGDMAVSNAVGSNIFDILFCLGFPWLIAFGMNGGEPLLVETENLISSIILLFATIVVIVFVLVVRKWVIGSKTGLFLIGSYLAYLVYIINVSL